MPGRIYLHHINADAQQGQERAPDDLELGLPVAVDHLMQVLGTESRTAVRAVNSLNH